METSSSTLIWDLIICLLNVQFVSTQIHAIYKGLPDKRFQNVMATVSASSVISCSTICQRTEGCTLTAYHKQSGVCEMSSFSKGDDNLIETKSGWNLYVDAADDCANNPCQNLGVCHDGIGYYTCTCTADFTGQNCETELCPVGWSQAGASCYFIDTSGQSWSAAQASCNGYTSGGHLVNINTAAENTAVIDLFNTHHPTVSEQIWIGGKDVGSNEVYYWTDGSPVSGGFEFWYADQPDNWGGSEDCMLLRSYQGFQWNDGDCASQFWSICEKELS